MPGIVRLGDYCSGHDGWPPRPNIEASETVFVNGLGVHRLGDQWAIHCNDSCHSGVASSSSLTVFCNSKGVCRVGDSVSCGSTMAEGSTDTFAGD
jgi:uncharacterized Zn-binding protein involved in type VI secretion